MKTIKFRGIKFHKKLLRGIEGFCILYENGPKTKQQAELIISDIYKAAHLASNCKNIHLNWRKEFLEMDKWMKKHKII